VRLYGLTGGIATGKSTAAGFFAELGVPIIDADRLARELVEPGQAALGEIARRWPEVIDRNGQLDRKVLAQRVFGEPTERIALEGILHPRIREEARRRAEALKAAGHVYALYEAALIFETGSDRDLDGVILVSAPVDAQRRRLAERDGLESMQADGRIAAQLSDQEKRRKASWVLENDGDSNSLREQVRALDALLRSRGP